jgi:prevent-host-death family protein
MAMKSVNVAELKNRLSHYLRLVRRGQPILVRDRDRVIARIEPAGDRDAAAGDDAERLAGLEERGILRRARAPFSREVLAGRPRVKSDVLAALLREREETR